MNLQVAHIINQAKQPLVVSDAFYPYILSLSHLLDAKVRLQLVTKPDGIKIPEGFSEVFLYHHSLALQNRFNTNQNSRLEVIVAQAEKRRFWLSKVVKL